MALVKSTFFESKYAKNREKMYFSHRLLEGGLQDFRKKIKKKAAQPPFFIVLKRAQLLPSFFTVHPFIFIVISSGVVTVEVVFTSFIV